MEAVIEYLQTCRLDSRERCVIHSKANTLRHQYQTYTLSSREDEKQKASEKSSCCAARDSNSQDDYRRDNGFDSWLTMPNVLVDSNVILDVVEDDPDWCEWSLGVLDRYSETHQLLINPIIYAEASIGFKRIEEFEGVLNAGGFKMVPIPKEALFLAEKAFVKYRRKQGAKTTPLPDFLIGAHAGVRLLTRDRKRIKHYFPSVTLVSPK